MHAYFQNATGLVMLFYIPCKRNAFIIVKPLLIESDDWFLLLILCLDWNNFNFAKVKTCVPGLDSCAS